MTQEHVEAKVSIVNGMLGFDDPQWDTVGAIRLYGGYGGYGVHRVMSTSGGVTELAGIGTLREAAQFLSGMIAALRLTRDAPVGWALVTDEQPTDNEEADNV